MSPPPMKEKKFEDFLIDEDWYVSNGKIHAIIRTERTSYEYAEYESKLLVFVNARCIGYCNEYDEYITIDEDFSDFKETGECEEDGTPIFAYNHICLDIGELQYLAQLISDWNELENEELKEKGWKVYDTK